MCVCVCSGVVGGSSLISMGFFLGNVFCWLDERFCGKCEDPSIQFTKIAFILKDADGI